LQAGILVAQIGAAVVLKAQLEWVDRGGKTLGTLADRQERDHQDGVIKTSRRGQVWFYVIHESGLGSYDAQKSRPDPTRPSRLSGRAGWARWMAELRGKK
jgi:hypothetical protein